MQQTNIKTYVYRNLRKQQLSLKQRNRVIGYAEAVVLTDVEFRVRESGRQRCLRERQKNVHAFAVGKMEPTTPDNIHAFKPGVRVSYNPYRSAHFFDVATGTPVHYGKRVLVTANNGIFLEENDDH